MNITVSSLNRQVYYLMTQMIPFRSNAVEAWQCFVTAQSI